MILADNFTEMLSEALASLPDDWDILLLGALGAVHPRYYHVNLGHAILAGGLRYPRGAASAFGIGPFGKKDGSGIGIHRPLRPFGTHAYAISERGARKLLTACPKANYHVDVIAWGMRRLKLYAVHPLLAKQTHEDTTIGGHSNRDWLPNMVIDSYTGTDFAWAWNAPLMQLPLWPRKLLVTSGRAMFSVISGFLLSFLLMGSYPYIAKPLFLVTLTWGGSLYVLLTLLTWPQARGAAIRAAADGASSSSSSSSMLSA